MARLEGTTINDRYEVTTFLGRGGMAEVYKAHDRHTGRDVALKFLRDDLAEDRVFLRRFRREAQVLEQLRHPNIMAYYGFEESGDKAFIVVEYVDGETLRRKLRRLKSPLTIGQALSILKPVCEALEYAHSLDIYHCDIKPANIMIQGDGRVVLTDFSIARMTGAATATSLTPGTPAYMAPEQCRGQEVSAQTDIYSLAVTLFEMITLERPFKGDTATIRGSANERIRWEQIRRPAPSPRVFNPDVPLTVARQIRIALSKKPSARHASAMQFFQSLLVPGVVTIDYDWHWEALESRGPDERLDEAETPST